MRKTSKNRLLATACHCLPLLATACHCLPLLATACHCLPLLAAKAHDYPGHQTFTALARDGNFEAKNVQQVSLALRVRSPLSPCLQLTTVVATDDHQLTDEETQSHQMSRSSLQSKTLCVDRFNSHQSLPITTNHSGTHCAPFDTTGYDASAKPPAALQFGTTGRGPAGLIS